LAWRKRYKYNVFQGSRLDMKRKLGTMISERCTEDKIKGFAARLSLDAEAFFDGEYVAFGHFGFWAEKVVGGQDG